MRVDALADLHRLVDIRLENLNQLAPISLGSFGCLEDQGRNRTNRPQQNQTFRADCTCTFVAWKAGFLAPAAQPYLGQVHVCDIGVPRRLIEDVVRRD